VNYRIFLAVAAVALGGYIAYVVTWNQTKVAPKKPAIAHPSEDPKNAFILPAKIHPVTEKMHAEAMAMTANKAADFSQPDAAGRVLSLSALTKSKPLLLYFIDKECPCCVTALPVVERVREAYREELNVVGVISAGGLDAKKWVDANQPSYPVLQDPDLRVIKAYKAKAGAYMALIRPGGTIDRLFPGYSRSMVKELGDRVAHLAKVRPRKMKLDDLSADPVSGCEFAVPQASSN